MNFPLKNAYYGGATDIKMGKTELSLLLSLTIKITWEKFVSPEMNLSWWDFKLKKMARAL